MKERNEWNELTPDEKRIMINKGTEYPNTGAYNSFYEKGTFVCRQCESPLYRSETKFNSGCGWPSFDDQIAKNVEHVLVADGHRTEIVCANCKGHLGHVFFGERFTEKDTRHCVNSISMKFVKD